MKLTQSQFDFLQQTCSLASHQLLKSTHYGDALTKNMMLAAQHDKAMQEDSVYMKALFTELLPVCNTPFDRYVMMESLMRVKESYAMLNGLDMYLVHLYDRLFDDVCTHLSDDHDVFYRSTDKIAHLKDKLPYGRTKTHVRHTLYHKALKQATELHAYRLSYNEMHLLPTMFLQERITLNAPSTLLRMHMSDGHLIASGPFFDAHIEQFKLNNATLTEHVVPRASTSDHSYHNKIWQNIPNQTYYIIS